MIGDWFTTDYDEPGATLDELPVAVSSGQSRHLVLVEDVVRGRQIIGRLGGDRGLVVLRWRGDGVPVRVAVLLHLDEAGTRMGADPDAGAPDEAGTRLVAVLAAGEIRGCVLLAAGQRATVEFDLPAGEVTDGLLLVEVVEPPRPAWAAGRLAARSVPGVRIDRITVRPVPDEPVPFAFPAARGLDVALLAPGAPETFVLKGPPPPKPPPPPVPPRSVRARRKLRRGFAKALRKLRRQPEPVVVKVPKPKPPVTFTVVAADLRTGAAVELEVVTRDAGGLTVRRPATADGPLLLALDAPDEGAALRVVPAAG